MILFCVGSFGFGGSFFQNEIKIRVVKCFDELLDPPNVLWYELRIRN